MELKDTIHGKLDQLEQIRELATKYAGRKCWSDDEEFTPDEYAGGNIDDAYMGGLDDGNTIMARKILEILYPPTDNS